MHSVRLTRAGSFCTGTLISADLTPREDYRSRFVLTCAHFFRDSRQARVQGHRFSRQVVAVHVVPGTDIAVAEMDRPSPQISVPRVAASTLPPGARVVTAGESGLLDGRLMLKLPFAVSRFSTLVRPALLLRSPAVKGDSGAGVFYQGAIYATQSLVFDPGGHNLGMATTASVAPHWATIRELIRRSQPPRHG